MKRIILSLVTIVAVAAIATGATVAYFSDTETSNSNTFAAGTLNLQVGVTDPSTWNFNLSNMKPGDNSNFDAAIKNIGTIDGDAKIDIAVSNSVEGDNLEPESDTTEPGDLDKQVRIIVYMQEDSGDGFTNIGAINGYASNLNGNSFDIPNTYDGWINDDSTDTKIRFRVTFMDDSGQPFDNDDAMGDSFDLDLTFHLDQVTL